MENENFEMEDLIMDESFQQYCMGTNSEAVSFWTNWVLDHPTKITEISQAKKICFLLAGNNSSENFVRDELAFHSLLNSKGIGTPTMGNEPAPNIKTTNNDILKPVFSKPSNKKRTAFWLFGSATIVIFLMGLGAYFLVFQNKKVKVIKNDFSISNLFMDDVAPGGNKAILTLANGQTINLTDTSIGKLAQQAAITITKTSNGQILFSINKNNVGNTNVPIAYNTIVTPLAGQYQIELADGTKVWLNAASSLKFPTTFANLNERKIELIGEAYFEVRHDSKKPFRVQTATQTVEDIGTSFNIDGYPDETFIKTTLLEGSVKVLRSAQSQFNEKEAEVVLTPGQQSTSNNDGNFKVSYVDTEESIAWKNGTFMFNDEPLEGILKKVSRWYDVDIKYDDTQIGKKTFGGTISRFGNLSDVLNILELTKEVHFNIKGREVTVSR